jgi:hypothetical protein
MVGHSNPRPGGLARSGVLRRSRARPYRYAGLAIALGVLVFAVGSFLGGEDHGIGSVGTGVIKDVVERAAGGGE